MNASVTEDVLAEANAPVTRNFSLPMSASRSRLVHSDTNSCQSDGFKLSSIDVDCPRFSSMTVGGREMEGEEDAVRGKLNRNCVGQTTRKIRDVYARSSGNIKGKRFEQMGSDRGF